jgi:hypothetical protein
VRCGIGLFVQLIDGIALADKESRQANNDHNEGYRPDNIGRDSVRAPVERIVPTRGARVANPLPTIVIDPVAENGTARVAPRLSLIEVAPCSPIG